MGYYAPSNSVSQYELWFDGGDNSIAITNVAADVALGTITLPATIQGTPRAAYLDVYLRQDDGAAHYFNNPTASYIRVFDGTTTIDNAAYRVTDFERKPVANIPGFTQIMGNTDISSLVVGGATLTITFMQAKVNANTTFYGLYFRLRVIT